MIARPRGIPRFVQNNTGTRIEAATIRESKNKISATRSCHTRTRITNVANTTVMDKKWRLKCSPLCPFCLRDLRQDLVKIIRQGLDHFLNPFFILFFFPLRPLPGYLLA